MLEIKIKEQQSSICTEEWNEENDNKVCDHWRNHRFYCELFRMASSSYDEANAFPK